MGLRVVNPKSVVALPTTIRTAPGPRGLTGPF